MACLPKNSKADHSLAVHPAAIATSVASKVKREPKTTNWKKQEQLTSRNVMRRDACPFNTLAGIPTNQAQQQQQQQHTTQQG